MDPDAVDELCSSGRGDTGETEPPEGDADERRTQAEKLRPRHGGTDDPWLLDFSANINPETPDGITQVYEAALAAGQSYPADDYSSFRAAAAAYADCEATQVIPTAGGLAAIRLTVATTVCTGDSVLVPYPSFSEYHREVRLQGGEPTFVHYDEILDIDPEEFELVMICTPNNPTGDAYDPDKLRKYAKKCHYNDITLLVDEAFLGFTELSTMAGLDGVIVVRSLTKLFGLPGLRAGFAVATGKHRDRLDATRLSWGLGTPASMVGEYCLGQSEFIEDTRKRVREERERMQKRLGKRFEVAPSDAPFLLLEPHDDGVDPILSTLREKDITVRDARTFRGLDNHIRVAVRLPEENDQLLDALEV